MWLYFLFLFLSLIVTLFCLYHVSREDFVLMRNNVLLDDVFNMAFVTFLVGLFFSRVFYVAFNFAPGFLNPLVFFLVPYYPGLSLMGGVIGGVLALFYIVKKQRFPIRRLFDLIGLSFLAGLPVGYIGSLFLTTQISFFFHLFLPVIFFIVFLIAYLYVYPKIITKELKPGMLGTSVLIVLSFVTLLVQLISNHDAGIFFFQPNNSLSLIVFVFSLLYFVKQELFVVKQKK